MPADLQALGKDGGSFRTAAVIGSLPSGLSVHRVLRGTSGARQHDLSSMPAACPAPSHFVGEASCHPHFAEFLQGATEVDKNGRSGTARFLVSVHMPGIPGSVAKFTLQLDRAEITVTPSTYTKSARAARLTLDRLGFESAGGRLEVKTFVPEGAGQGSSTTGCVASARASAAAVSKAIETEITLSPYLQAEIAVAAEQACDSVMFDCTGTTLLFEHRTGLVRKTLGGPLPRMLILGFDTSAGGGVDTDEFPRARYSSAQIADFGVAIATLERAIQEQSVDLVGRVATFSAMVNQSNLPKPNFDATINIKDVVGSAGIVVAHSGTVAGLIFDPALPDLSERVADAQSRIVGLGFGRIQSFTTPF